MNLKDELIKFALKQAEAHQKEIWEFVSDNAATVADTLFDGFVSLFATQAEPTERWPEVTTEPQQPPIVTPPKPPQPENKPYNFSGIIPLEIWER